jgi:hypothetical protein
MLGLRNAKCTVQEESLDEDKCAVFNGSIITCSYKYGDITKWDIRNVTISSPPLLLGSFVFQLEMIITI